MKHSLENSTIKWISILSYASAALAKVDGKSDSIQEVTHLGKCFHDFPDIILNLDKNVKNALSVAARS